MADLLRSESAGSLDSRCVATVRDMETVFDDRVARILDGSINQLFSVTMRLTAMATEQTDARTVNRLLGAVREIDDAIRGLRADLIAELMKVRDACDGEHLSWE